MTEIPLTRGYMAVIDDGDAELVGVHRWRVLIQPHTCYAIARLPRRGGKQCTLYVHRLIVGAKPGERFLHLDGNGLNNTRGNLSVSGATRTSTAACIEETLGDRPGAPQ